MKHAFVLTIWLSTLAAVFVSASHGWWLPLDVVGYNVDTQRQFIIVITTLGVAFAVAQTSFGYMIQRLRTTTREKEVTPSPSSNRVEIAWTVATAVVFFMLAMMGQYVWVRIRSQKAAASTVQVSRVVQRQQPN